MREGGSVSGAVSLVMIFCVLCLAVFAALTLSTAVGEQSLTTITAERTQAYYEADAQAVEIVTALAAGQSVDTDVTWTTEEDGDTAEFSLPCGGEQMLEVKVRFSGGSWEVLTWRSVYAGEWIPDDSLTLIEFD